MLRLAAGAGIAALALSAGAAAVAPRGFPTFGPSCVRADFRSAGETVRAERCGPAAGQRAVVVLHGCGGFGTFDHRLAAELPAHGIATLDVDYFGPTPPPGNRGFCGGGGFRGDPRTLFETWERVAADAARSLRSGYVHVGAAGWSLGAGVALATAEQSHAFDAVAAYSALAGPEELAAVHGLPPTIFLDGGRRDIVPPANAEALYAAARAAHVPSALYVYGDGTHGWPGAQGAAGIARGAAFLRRYLP